MAQDLPERSVVQNLANAPPDECWAPFGSMLSCVEPLFGLDGSSVGAAVLLGVLTFIGAVLIAFGRWIWKSIAGTIRERRLRKNTFVDFLRSAQFIHEYLSQQVDPEAIAVIKENVDKASKNNVSDSGDEGEKNTENSKYKKYLDAVEYNNFRLFGVNNSDDSPLDRMRSYRSYFTPKETFLIDTYIYLFQLYSLYYDKLGSDSFVQLSNNRKKAAIDNLATIGRSLIEASEDLLNIRVFQKQDEKMDEQSFANQIKRQKYS